MLLALRSQYEALVMFRDILAIWLGGAELPTISPDHILSDGSIRNRGYRVVGF
jgi:hypothetical protein